MLLFAIFTLGYFAGVFTALFVFPPNTTELEEQEVDALRPIIDMSSEKGLEQAKRTKEKTTYHPALFSS